MKILKNIFYSFYQVTKSEKIDTDPEYRAVLLMTLTILQTFYGIQSIAYLFGYNFSFGLDTKYEIGGIVCIILLILYFVIIYKNKYLEIIKLYETENTEKKLKRKRVTIIYIVISAIVLILSLFLMAKKNRGEF